MGTEHSPTVRRRRLALELRRLREAARLTCEEVAEHLECSASKISRVETGRVSVSPRDVRDMLELYGVPADQRESLVQLARDSRQKGWWHAYSDTMQPQMATYIGLESAASEIRIYEVSLIPGLLQTEDYARAVIRAGMVNSPAEDIERRVSLLMARQPAVIRDDPPKVWAVLDEAALRRPPDGRAVTRAQLEHLLEITDLPNVTLQIIPFKAGPHPAAGGPFTILRFPEPDLPDVVYLEQLSSAQYLDQPDDVMTYLAVMNQLCVQAANGSASRDMLRTLLKET